MNDPAIVAQRLKTARELKKLSQVALAERAFTTNKQLSLIERGRASMSISLAVSLGRALGVRPSWLLDLEEEQKIDYGEILGIEEAVGQE